MCSCPGNGRVKNTPYDPLSTIGAAGRTAANQCQRICVNAGRTESAAPGNARQWIDS